MALAAALTAGPAAAAVIDTFRDTHLLVRVYDGAAVPAGDRQTALANAAGILERAGLAVEWRICGADLTSGSASAGPGSADPCAAALADNELAVRFVRLPAPPNRRGGVTLGSALVDTRARAGSLATIFVDRVTGLARSCQVDVRVVLGRAIAHEIGHLLLGTNGHAPTGLMREVWSRETLQRGRTHDWVFTAGDSQAMRDAVRTRLAKQMAAHRLGPPMPNP